MSEYYGQGQHLTTSDKLFGTTALSGARADTIKKTYLLLSVSVLAAFAGGMIGSQTPAIVNLFSGWMGWIIAMVALNGIPYVAMAVRNHPFWGPTALVADGFVAGLVLSPMLFVASVVMGQPGLVTTAMMITGMIFIGVTFYVMTTNKQFSAPRGLMAGLFFATIGVIVLNAFLNIGFLGLLISVGIGLIGLLCLLYSTSDVLNNPEFNSPVAGALMLFAGLFNIFVAVLSILMRFGSND